MQNTPLIPTAYRIETTRPLQTVWTFEFDEANRLSAVVDPNTRRTEYGYDPNGNRTSIKDANNHTRTFEKTNGVRSSIVVFSAAIRAPKAPIHGPPSPNRVRRRPLPHHLSR